MIVEGAVVDVDGARRAYVRFRKGQVVEVGSPGTDSSRGKEHRVHGIVTPRPVNSHTHLGDAAAAREPPHAGVAEIVGPGGLKFRLLAERSAVEKEHAMRSALERMVREGVGAVVDFREEGVPGVAQLRRASAGLPIEVRALGRPTARPIVPGELSRLLRIADGIGVSSAREETFETRNRLADRAHRMGKWFALHASEEVREKPDEYMRPRPDLLVHLTKASPDDLETVAKTHVPVAVCLRSNALFGRSPDLAAFARAGVRLLIGSDNAMLNAPSIFRETEFAYLAGRWLGHPVDAQYLARAAYVEPWLWLDQPGRARIAPGMTGTPLAFRLPTEDPAYQLVTRATAQLIVPTGAERGE
ncbi:MAG: amidohydrolase family protein [Thermoplasmata archaeon]|nr:amidohydrolase family protein [Thermoplasmata archaeon]